FCVRSQVLMSLQASICAFWFTTPFTFVKGVYQRAVASLKLILTVIASGMSTEAMFSYCAVSLAPFSGFMMKSKVALISADVTAEPSDHFRPSFSFHVTLFPSAATEPSAWDGIALARTGIFGYVESIEVMASGSRTTREASESLVPSER